MELLYFTIVSLLGVIAASECFTGNYRCPSPNTTYCRCHCIGYSEYNCQPANMSPLDFISVAVYSQKRIKITCRGSVQSWPDLIEGINATGSIIENATDAFESLQLFNCSIPKNESVAEVLKKLSVKSIKKLELEPSQGINNVLKDRYLENLGSVHSLKIKEDITPFPKKMLDGMPNLTSIELPQHVMSAIRLEVLKIEAEKRSSNSTHNNTSTDLTIIKKLSEFSELNLRNSDLNILVGRTSSLNLQSVNLTNNNITFLLFEKLPNLTNISLTDNKIDSLQEGTFSNLPKLKQISIDHNEMSQLESGTFKDLRSLLNVSLSGNNLTYLPGYLFEHCTNLTILDISKNKLTALNETSLHGLKRLKTLLLQDNLLMKIERPTFQGLSSLEELNLQNNRLMYLELLIFNHPEDSQIFFTNENDSLILISKCAVREINLKNNSFKGYFSSSKIQLSSDNSLRFLDLSYNNIQSLSVEVTLNRSNKLPELTVTLDYNKIATFAISNFETVSGEDDQSLNYTGGLNMSLAGNPFDCDNEKTLNFFRSYFRQKKNSHAIKMMNTGEMKCARPQNRKDIPIEFVQNQPKILLSMGIICGTLSFILIIGAGFSIYTHYINAAHRILRLFLVTQPDGSTKQNAILFHSHLDEKFITGKLASHLKNAFKGLETSLVARDWRDWNSTKSEDDQIAALARKSEIIIIVLSTNFLKTVWAKHTFKTAILKGLKNYQDRTVIISLLNVVTDAILDSDLGVGLPRNKYLLLWKDEKFREKLEKSIRALRKTFQEKLNRDSNFVEFEDLKKITKSWSEILGHGGFGCVYKGFWNGTDVAVKCPNREYNKNFNIEREREQSRLELEFLQTCRHPNILLLLGWSLDDEGRAILISRYMPRGSLRKVLFSQNKRQHVSWKERLDIAKGTASGLQYLHEKNIIHLDIKCENILLDEHLVPQIGDFGLTRESLWAPDSNLKGALGSCAITNVHGTPEYLPDDYKRTKKPSTKVDTYSYGMVLLEMTTGQIESRKKPFLRNSVRKSKHIRLLMDPTARDENQFIFNELIELGKKCVEDEAKDRPKMCEVSAELVRITVNTSICMSEIATPKNSDWSSSDIESGIAWDNRQQGSFKGIASGLAIQKELQRRRETEIVQSEKNLLCQQESCGGRLPFANNSISPSKTNDERTQISDVDNRNLIPITGSESKFKICYQKRVLYNFNSTNFAII